MKNSSDVSLIEELFNKIKAGKVYFLKGKTESIVGSLKKVKFDKHGKPIMGSVTREVMVLARTLRWIKNERDKYLFHNEREYMEVCIELMSYLLDALHDVIALTVKSRRYNRGLKRNDAMLAGLMVRGAKLFEGIFDMARQMKMEFAHIFIRCLMETSVNLLYLLNKDASYFETFVNASFRREIEILQDIKKRAKGRPLTPREERMIDSIEGTAKDSEVNLEEVARKKPWKKRKNARPPSYKPDTREMMENIGWEETYLYSYASPSHAIHGDWRDIRFYHVLFRDGRYCPNPRWREVDCRVTCPASVIMIESALAYLTLIDDVKEARESKSCLVLLRDEFRDLNDAYELYIQKSKTGN